MSAPLGTLAFTQAPPPGVVTLVPFEHVSRCTTSMLTRISCRRGGAAAASPSSSVVSAWPPISAGHRSIPSMSGGSASGLAGGCHMVPYGVIGCHMIPSRSGGSASGLAGRRRHNFFLADCPLESTATHWAGV